MAISRDDRRAALVLLGLAAAGLLVRLVAPHGEAPGAVGYRPAPEERPVRDSVAARARRLSRPLAPGERIDVDRAPAGELVRLPGIGPVLAGRIVADRDARGPFGTLKALDRVSGIGPVLLEALEPHVAFSGPRRTGRWGRAIPPGRPFVSLNTAMIEDLVQLPGVGPWRAQAIIDDRRRNGPYRRLEDLQRVPGIGPATIERLKGLVVP